MLEEGFLGQMCDIALREVRPASEGEVDYAGGAPSVKVDDIPEARYIICEDPVSGDHRLVESSGRGARGALYDRDLYDRHLCDVPRERQRGTFHIHAFQGTGPTVTDAADAAWRDDRLICIGGRKGGGVGVACYLNEWSTLDPEFSLDEYEEVPEMLEEWGRVVGEPDAYIEPRRGEPAEPELLFYYKDHDGFTELARLYFSDIYPLVEERECR